MITKERLEELIKQEATIYYIGFDTVEELILDGFCWRIGDNYLWQGLECYEDIEDLYETEQEAEFVAKNHDTEIIEFKPPFDFKESKEYYFNTKKGKGRIVYNNYGLYEVDYVGDSYYANHNFSDYQEAVDYAHKLFKGEE